jgi:two-component system NtrC family sensor kinase
MAKAIAVLLGIGVVTGGVLTAALADAGALWMLAIGLSGFVVICLLAGRFLLRLTSDLRRLARRAQRMERGDDAELLELRRGDEVDELAEAIEKMAGALTEKEIQLDAYLRRLPRAEKLAALGAFAAGIAHEIANPIHAIRALCEQVTARVSDEQGERSVADEVKALEMILEQGERIERAVQDLRELALPARDRMEPTSINLALESALKLLRYDRRFKGIEVIADLSPDVPMVHGVAEQLTQLGINALMSAADAIEDDGKITVTSRPEGDGVLVTIEDNGRAMSADPSRRGLAPSFTTESYEKDTGLGLAVCKGIVDRHAGTLQVESGSDRGTTVRICIPAMSEAGDR